MNILGLKATGHDTGAALISGKRIIAIAEERLNRVKHSQYMFPELSIQYCLDAFGLQPKDIDLIVIDQFNSEVEYPTAKIFREWDSKHAFAAARLEIINHHDAHAASAFFCSPFDEAAVLVYDGHGEKFFSHYGIPIRETETLYFGEKNRLVEIQKTTHLRNGIGFIYTIGVGNLYTYLCREYLGLGKYNEGKMMGLATYGDDRIIKQYPMEQWFKEIHGHFFCNPRIRFPKPKRGHVVNNSAPQISFREKVRKIIREAILAFGVHILTLASQGKYRFFSEPTLFQDIIFDKVARTNEPLPDPYYASVAYAGQKLLEEISIRWGNRLKEIARSENLCVAGGVGLNIDANRNYLDKVGFKQLFVQPGASDTGVPLGCALYGVHVIAGEPRWWRMKSASLGRSYTDNEIQNALGKKKDLIVVSKSKNICKETAELIANGNIIGWFHGGSEYGPRSLGNRSILCDARDQKMKDILNIKVKHREPWRPFATSILEEHLGEWFDIDVPSPFMLLAASVRKDKAERIPAVLHVDNTSRIQSVTPESNKRYAQLLDEFLKITGVPLVLNTSFNLGGDPIVETPEDALNCFLKTKMDYLVLEDYLVKKMSHL